MGELAELVQWLPADSAREQLREGRRHQRVCEEMSDVLVYLVGMADQCGVDLHASALGKIQASSQKYPVEQHRGVAPDRT